MKVLYDTDVILDVLLQRKPFDIESAQVMNYVEDNTVDGYLCATTLTNIHYIVTRSYTADQSLKGIRHLLRTFDVAIVNHSVLEDAAQNNFKDFEDAVLYESAKLAGTDAIVTRNTRDFKSASLPIYTPHELLNILNEAESEDN